MPVGDGVLDVPTAARRQFGICENLPIEVKFSRRVVEDADPYGSNAIPIMRGTNSFFGLAVV